MATTRTIKEIYEAELHALTLTDQELEVGIEHFGKLAELLFPSGPVFRLAAQEAARIERRFREYRTARQEQKKR